MFRRRRRFDELIARQLDLFEEEQAELIAACQRKERAYDDATREEAEERYGEYQDVVEEVTEALADLRDHYKRTLADSAADQYEAEFNRAVVRRFPRFAAEIDLR
jgi:hypothetical protein